MSYKVRTNKGDYENILRFKNKDDVIWELMQLLSQYSESQLTVTWPDGSYLQTDRWD